MSYILRHSQSAMFEGLEDDAVYTPEKSSRRSVKKLVIRSSPAVGMSSHQSSSDRRQGTFSSPSLFGSSRGGVRDTNDHSEEMTFNLSSADRIERKYVMSSAM